jgi:hypothetical protein
MASLSRTTSQISINGLQVTTEALPETPREGVRVNMRYEKIKEDVLESLKLLYIVTGKDGPLSDELEATIWREAIWPLILREQRKKVDLDATHDPEELEKLRNHLLTMHRVLITDECSFAYLDALHEKDHDLMDGSDRGSSHRK